MRFERDDPGFDRIVTMDIETTHYDPQQGEVVSVGVGEHRVGEPASEASYHLSTVTTTARVHSSHGLSTTSTVSTPTAS